METRKYLFETKFKQFLAENTELPAEFIEKLNLDPNVEISAEVGSVVDMPGRKQFEVTITANTNKLVQDTIDKMIEHGAEIVGRPSSSLKKMGGTKQINYVNTFSIPGSYAPGSRP